LGHQNFGVNKRLKNLERWDIEGSKSIETLWDLLCFDKLEFLGIGKCWKLRDVKSNLWIDRKMRESTARPPHWSNFKDWMEWWGVNFAWTCEDYRAPTLRRLGMQLVGILFVHGTPTAEKNWFMKKNASISRSLWPQSRNNSQLPSKVNKAGALFIVEMYC